ncbi:MAG: hypothetical protein ACD_3C00083G0012 [uncultured bacterium (gcode 4)]|uniref:Glycosyltransferase 2-like domain-containing protein n=1 Tax=uncultured bacterium (gcode 4) TaxID=1234023 RepID=K2FZ74_9BACT|nr:MAG: hypothetical protein ACD_3C00083G0012 [uncultured bacterium (gcode 4)]
MSAKLINILLPVYNWESSLEACLENISWQIINDELWKYIDIVLCDDCSSDSSPEIIKKFTEKYEFIKSYPNDANLWMDGNFYNCVEKSNSEYVWFCWQDDIFLVWALKLVANSLLENKDIWLMYLDYFQYNEEFDKVVCDSMIKNISTWNVEINKELVIFSSSKEYFNALNDVPGFLPATVMKRAYWNETDAKRFFWTYFVQYWVFLLNMNEWKIGIINKPIIKWLIPSDWWQKNWNKLFEITIWWMKARTIVNNDKRSPFIQGTFENYKKRFVSQYFKLIVLCKVYGLKLKENQLNDLKFIFWNWMLYKLYLMPLVYIPCWSICKKIIAYINSIRRI